MSRTRYQVPVIYCLLIIGLYIAEHYDSSLMSSWAILPLNPAYLKGIITAVFIHANVEHLSSNLLPFAVCIFGLFYFYNDIALKITLLAHLATGILIWLFARPVFHVGASGLIYALVLFILSSALIKRNKKLIVFAFIVLTFQGGLIWGLVPQNTQISWESHLYGAITGIVLAIIFRKYGPEPEKDPLIDEDFEDTDDYKHLSV